MNIVLKKTKIPVNISKKNKSKKYLIEGDASRSIGILHCTHEFSLSISMKNNTPKFLGGYEIACEDIDYPKGEEGVKCLEFMHPGLYEDILSELKTLTA